jgi:crotonobetainyl-CoA:carnitine CoA-transferase CaiB-like acyl-CoA transferase
VPALDGVRILDLAGGVAGPLGVLHLAEHGADVIKLEPPGGRTDRRSPASRAYNRSRRSVTLDLKQADGVGVFRQLCATADVVVEAFGSDVMARLGLDYESLREEFPGLVYCSIPAWPTGTRYQHRPGYEALVHARTGQQWENPSFRPGPVFLHSPVASLAAAFLVPIGIMAALVARDQTGKGQHVEVSLVQGVLSLTTQNWNWTERGQFMLGKRYPSTHQMSVYECADGEWIHAATMAGVPQTRSEGEILGVRDVSFGALYTMAPEARAEFDAERRTAFRAHDRDQLVEEYHAGGLGAEAIVAPHQRFAHPQLQATDSVVRVDDPEIGPTTQVGPTIFLESTPGRVSGPQPGAGEHTDEVLLSLGYLDAELARLRRDRVI